jgi:hypothetical protein
MSKETKEFNLSEKRKELFEKELIGKITSAGRIYRIILEQDKEFIRLLKEEIDLLPVTNKNNIPYQKEEVALILSGMKSWFRKKIDKLAGLQLSK